jgi:N-methylhydantoinase A/oxoprolinase/acetone carboxylase beta subunit
VRRSALHARAGQARRARHQLPRALRGLKGRPVCGLQLPLIQLPQVAQQEVVGHAQREHLHELRHQVLQDHAVGEVQAAQAVAAVAQGQAPALPATELPKGDGDPSAAKIRDHKVWIDGAERPAVIYDRAKLRQGDIIEGPAIITEMDSTTLVEHDCRAAVDAVGNILITLKTEG